MHLKRLLTLCLLAQLLIGCAGPGKPNPVDPYEGFNRGVYRFNTAFDKVTFKPLATLYSKTPDAMQHGVHNFIVNIQTISSFMNNALQLRPLGMSHDFWRFAINTTVGIGGLFDPAQHIGLKDNNQNFGQTLARWGYHHSAYLMIPILGPSTVRDGIGVGVDYFYLSAIDQVTDERQWQNRYTLMRMIDHRARLLPADKAAEESFDPYVFVRNAYLQKRAKAIEATVGKPIGPIDAHAELAADAAEGTH